MRKRLFLSLLVLLLALMCGCGQGGHDPTDDMELVVTEPAFIPDYNPGEENTRSSTAWSFCVQQGDWLYYTSYEGHHDNSRADYILKYPIGGDAEDVQVILSQGALGKGVLSCSVCGAGVHEFVSLEAVLGDWIYINMKDGHLIRLRTDGQIVENVLCSKPEAMVTNLCMVFRDHYLYYVEQITRHLDASTTASTYYLHKVKLDTLDDTTVGEIEWAPDDFESCCAVFQEDGSFYIDGGSCIAEIKPDDEISTFRYSFAMERYEKVPLGYRLLPGVSSGLIFTSNHTSFVPGGLYSLGHNALTQLPSDFIVTWDEYAARGGWRVWSDFLLPGSEDVKGDALRWIVDVDKGFACNLNEKDGLVYYSIYDRLLYKINNDVGEYLFWSEDEELLYYQTRADGVYYLCRTKLDGTEWEDVSWLTYVPEEESHSIFG